MMPKLIHDREELYAVLTGEAAVRVQTVNLHHLYLAKDQQFQRLIEEADYVTADGWPVQLLLHTSQPRRVTGSEFVENLCSGAVFAGARVALVGASSSAGDELSILFAEQGITLVFREHGLAGDWRMDDLASEILEASPDLLLIAVSPPTGEWVATELHRRIVKANRGIGVIAVGGAVDMVVGAQARAPEWSRKLGIEWAVRMLADPKRLARRYLLECLPVFLVGVLPATLLRASGLDKGA